MELIVEQLKDTISMACTKISETLFSLVMHAKEEAKLPEIKNFALLELPNLLIELD